MTSANFSPSQRTVKPATRSRRGIVASQHWRAAAVGAEVLEAGGDAVDAAVATSLALGVLEPWMSGPAGGGAMMVWRQEEQRAYAFDYGMASPAGLDPSAYPLDPDRPPSDKLFPWPVVKEDRNALGPLAVAVPGTIAGIETAHGRWGRMPWRDLALPAANLARQGLAIDWYAALVIASCARELSADPASAATFLEDGRWPMLAGWTALSDKRVSLGRMADTLERLAHAGPRDFYEGDIAAAIARDIQAAGGFLDAHDLASYRVREPDPLTIAYRDATIWAVPGLTAGPTLADTLARLGAAWSPKEEAAPDTAFYASLIAALQGAYARRLDSMGDEPGEEVPACTTHFAVVDAAGNIVCQTQTLLEIFGAKLIGPSTGLLMNNGMLWFDTEPGKPNSIAPGKRCLMNVCPVIGEYPVGETHRRFAVGASGGRKIMPAVANLLGFLVDYRMDLDRAFHTPRVDASGPAIAVADNSLPPETLESLAGAFDAAETRRTMFPYAFACPAGVMIDAEGIRWGATEPLSPWGDAVAAG